MTTTDQPKLARSRLLVADAFTRDRAAASRPDTHDLAGWLLDQLQDLGWKAPPDPGADIPPLRPPRVATDAERRAHLATIRATLDRQDPPSTTSGQTIPGCGTVQTPPSDPGSPPA